jgi:hypothetical protein
MRRGWVLAFQTWCLLLLGHLPLPLCDTPKGKPWITTALYYFREKYVTIIFNDVKDFNKVCSKLRLEFSGERIDGSVKQEDFYKMQTKVIDDWSNSSDYKVLDPVRYIGPQVYIERVIGPSEVHELMLINICQLHIMKGEMKNINPDTIEFFFNKTQGVIGTDGLPKANPRVSYLFWSHCKNETT